MQDGLVDRVSDATSEEILNRVYQAGLIAPEKKPFLIDLQRSFGPFLAIEGSDQLILDACSQIATMGLGFNASASFGCAQHLESWTGQWQTNNAGQIATAYRNLLVRQLNHQSLSSRYHVHFCSSGAEAIEIALGTCFDRAPPKAKKVLAFEGSFHGRMLVALSATWNPQKREPFAWPGYESVFVPYPALENDDIQGPVMPSDWIQRWASASERSSMHDFEPGREHESLLGREVATLNAVDQYLKSGEIFAILIEPMQCEGGDRYSSSRFHQGLINLAESYEVPLIYDEIQTGLHLGRQFYWHRQFRLRDRLDHPTGPSMIVTAKKAQVGVVISRFPIRYQETFCPASLFRGYATASMLDQFDDQINRIENNVRENLTKLILGYRELIHRPRGQGLAFAFDFYDAKKLEQFVNARFRHGLLFYSAGKHTARFRLNLAFRDPQLSLLWQQLDRCLAGVMGTDPNPQFRLIEPSGIKLPADTETNYQLHQTLIASKRSTEGIFDASCVRDYVASNVPLIFDSACDVVMLNRDNYPEFRDRILQMQTHVYEPARQTPPEEFDLLFADGSSIDSQAILVLNDDRIVAMAFAGELKRFIQERGVASDPYLKDPTAFYMVDLTVAKAFRGRLGRILKSAITLLAQINGVTAIHGRNRDYLARSMWAINLSLGSFELRHLVDDYPDEHEHRDCIYYRAPIMWNTSQASASGPVPYLPVDSLQLPDSFFRRNLPSMVNKVCLSNFVDKGFLDDLSEVSMVLPEKLRHVYTASGLSESVDKITKAIWRKRAPRTGLITIEGCYFGETGFLSRSLSNVGRAYFEVMRLAADDLIERLGEAISTDRWLAFYLDPHVAERVKGISPETLRTCIGMCREAGVPVVLNETGTEFGTARQFSQIDGMLPDAGVAWLGGQMALAYTHSEYFANDPLLLISTWDGDAYALARYAEALRQHRCGSMNLVSSN